MKNRMYTPNEVRNATEYIKELFDRKEITIHEWNVYINIMDSLSDNWNTYPRQTQNEFITIMDLFDKFLTRLEYRFDLHKKLTELSTLN